MSLMYNKKKNVSDFTYKMYNLLLKCVKESRYDVYGVADYIKEKPEKDFIMIMRHDVDRNINAALDFAKLESKHGIKSTYYIRYKDKLIDERKIKLIHESGHEVGYHYETLDKAKGDASLALKMFDQELSHLRKIVPIETVCMHGNFWSKWDNKSIWKHKTYDDFDLLAEAFLSFNFDEFHYYTETGHNWNPNRGNIKDHSMGIMPKNYVIANTTKELINIIKSNKINHIYLQTHPNRWSKTSLEYVYKYCFNLMANTMKYFIKRVN